MVSQGPKRSGYRGHRAITLILDGAHDRGTERTQDVLDSR